MDSRFNKWRDIILELVERIEDLERRDPTRSMANELLNDILIGEEDELGDEMGGTVSDPIGGNTEPNANNPRVGKPAKVDRPEALKGATGTTTWQGVEVETKSINGVECALWPPYAASEQLQGMRRQVNHEAEDGGLGGRFADVNAAGRSWIPMSMGGGSRVVRGTVSSPDGSSETYPFYVTWPAGLFVGDSVIYLPQTFEGPERERTYNGVTETQHWFPSYEVFNHVWALHLDTVGATHWFMDINDLARRYVTGTVWGTI